MFAQRLAREASKKAVSSVLRAQKKNVAAGGAFLAAGLMSAANVYADEENQHAPHYHWSHSGMLGAFDHASMRRGYEVYRQVCSTCHSMDMLCFRNLVGHTHTEEQAKALAQSYEVEDGPNEEGEMFERPGKLSDHFPRPYANEEMARYINGGALPPDLSCVSKARHGEENYVFSLLTGYLEEPPAGVNLREGLHWNKYFPGGAISMAPPLSEGGVEYEDGTYASVSQQAKDVATFLAWCSEPDTDSRKEMGIQFVGTCIMMSLASGYYKRFKWSTIKTRKISYTS